MRKIRKDLTGKTYGRLTVIKPMDSKLKNSTTVYECKCTCGKIVTVRMDNLVSGDTKSCGCLKQEIVTKRVSNIRTSNLQHGTNLGRISKTGLQRNNTSGVRGVSWHKKTGKWSVRIHVAGKPISLGYTSDLEEAKQMRKEAEAKYFKPLIEAKD